MSSNKRWAAKRDGNEQEIVDALTKVGCTVTRLNEIGAPDLLVGRAGVNYTIEIKDPSQPAYNQHLTPLQIQWHQWWDGQKAIVKTIDQALEVVGIKHGRHVAGKP